MATRSTLLALIFLGSVLFVKGNSAPAFTGTYPQPPVSFSEGSATPAGTELFTLTATDADGVTPVLSFTYDPADTLQTLEKNETSTTGTAYVAFTLKANRELDYETQPTFKVYVDAYDGVAYAVGVLVTLQVLDVGETPTLDPATNVQNFSIAESPTGTIIGQPGFTINDGDAFEVHTWSITGGTGTSYVNVYSTNGTALLKTDYDLETVGTPTDVYVDVEIVDKYGLSVTLTYSVFVSDANDNIPVFNPTVYAFEVNQTLASGTVLATLNATDGDVSSPNNALTYSLDSSSIADYFTLAGADLTLAYTVDIAYGSGPYTFYVYATDGGSPALTATATVSVTVPPATTTATTTTDTPPAGYDFGGSTTNVVLMIVACFVAACLLGYVLVLCWRWHTFGECLPSRCPTSQECNKCCECCHGDKDDEEKITGGSDDGSTPAIFSPSSKKGLEAMGGKSNGSPFRKF